MRTDLYRELLIVEETHWWHKAKQSLVYHIFSHIFSQNRTQKPRILDVGCGTGKIMHILKPFGETWGVDKSQEALRLCRRRGIKRVFEALAEKMPFTDSFFDAVCLLDVLEHVNDVLAIQEAYRILKRKGLVIIVVPAYMFLWSEWDRVLGHKRRYTRTQLKTLLEASGFMIYRLTYFHSFLLFPALVIRSVRSVFIKQKQYTSDFKLNNPLLNYFFGFLSRLEQTLMKRYDIPFGTSVVCIAQKK